MSNRVSQVSWNVVGLLVVVIIVNALSKLLTYLIFTKGMNIFISEHAATAVIIGLSFSVALAANFQSFPRLNHKLVRIFARSVTVILVASIYAFIAFLSIIKT